MTATEDRPDWTDANQRLLVAEFERIRALLSGRGDHPADELERSRAAMPAPAAIDRVARLFGLSAFERDVLLLAAGVEMDSALAALCADSAEGPRRPHATFGLALAVLQEPHWSALTPVRPLRRWRLVEPSDDSSVTTARLRVDERVLHYLAGVNYLDPRLQPLVRRSDEPPAMADAHRHAVEAIVERFERAGASAPLLQLHGDDAHGRQDVAAAVAARLGLQLFTIAASDVPSDADECATLATLWEREAALLDASLLIESADGQPTAAALRFAERVAGLAILGAREPAAPRRETVTFRIDKPDRSAQLRLWEEALGPSAALLNGSVGGVAQQFRLSAQEIARAAAEVAREAPVSSDADALLWRTCRDLQRTRLDGLAQRIEPAAEWDALVLPESQTDLLRQIATHVRQRLRVHEQWGFAARGARGLGVSALFAGESGTGKTMAAEVLAGELHLELFRIDLSAVVSKYIGETEKNLCRVFDAAENGGAILLFDEADALFGKRSEVRDSHDRYANIEVSYLLQRMEAYRGLAILTTNQKTALDSAFMRRLRFVLQFPFPDAAHREAIWRKIFPAATPTRGLDFTRLARLSVAGGHIRNIALGAAFFAAEEAGPVSMRHLLRAAHADAAKRERPLADAETRGWG